MRDSSGAAAGLPQSGFAAHVRCRAGAGRGLAVLDARWTGGGLLPAELCRCSGRRSADGSRPAAPARWSRHPDAERIDVLLALLNRRYVASLAHNQPQTTTDADAALARTPLVALAQAEV